MSITQGSPLPDVKTTTTTVDNAPNYYTNFLQGMSNVGTAAMGKTGNQLVAGLDPMQQQGYAAVAGAADAYKPGLGAAQDTAAQAAQGITPERITGLMNPYTSGVVDEMARLSQQNMQRNLLPTMKAGFVGSGGLGSQRYAGALGQSMADIQANLTGAQTGALQKGYSEALKASLDEAQLQNEAAKTQGLLAEKEQTLGLTGAGALSKAGAEQQAYRQAILDAPLKNATNVSGLMRGYNMPVNRSETFLGPKAGSYQTSDLSNIMGIMGILGATKEGTAGSKLFDYIGKQVSGINPSSWFNSAPEFTPNTAMWDVEDGV